MERERGIVDQADSQKAVIHIQQSSHCATCASREDCHAMNDKVMRIEVANKLNVKAGDHVEIAVPTRSLLKLSLIVYLVPILMLMVGAFVGQQWGKDSSSDATMASVIGGISAMAISFLGLKGLDRKMRGKVEYSPRITKILSSASPPEHGDNK